MAAMNLFFGVWRDVPARGDGPDGTVKFDGVDQWIAEYGDTSETLVSETFGNSRDALDWLEDRLRVRCPR